MEDAADLGSSLAREGDALADEAVLLNAARPADNAPRAQRRAWEKRRQHYLDRQASFTRRSRGLLELLAANPDLLRRDQASEAEIDAALEVIRREIALVAPEEPAD